MNKVAGFVDKSSLLLSRISTGIIWIIVLLVAVNIVGRKLFNFSISGIIEIVQYGMLTVMAISMARTTFIGGHVSVSIITAKLPKLVRCIIDFLSMMFSAALIIAAAYICIQYIPKTLASGQVTEVYKIPFYIIYSVMTFGLITSALTFIFNAFNAVVTAITAKNQKGTQGGLAE